MEPPNGSSLRELLDTWRDREAVKSASEYRQVTTSAHPHVDRWLRQLRGHGRSRRLLECGRVDPSIGHQAERSQTRDTGVNGRQLGSAPRLRQGRHQEWIGGIAEAAGEVDSVLAAAGFGGGQTLAVMIAFCTLRALPPVAVDARIGRGLQPCSGGPGQVSPRNPSASI